MNKIDIFFTIAIVLCACIAFCSVNAMADEPEKPQKITSQVESAPESEELDEVEQVPVLEEKVEEEAPVVLYDVPLDESLQLHIIETAEFYGIDPAIIFAMAYRESTYNTKAIGDGGNSLGLLQIQERWHSKRMGRLGADNLLDPYQNVLVGVDFLAELLERYDGNMTKALVAYNKGHYPGYVTQYARDVLAKAEELAVIA